MNGNRDAVVLTIDENFTGVEFAARLREEGARRGPFRLVLDVCEHVEGTMEMARAWLQAVLDQRIPLTELTVASRAKRTHVLTQAVAVAARHKGSHLPIEAFGSVESALSWRGRVRRPVAI